jgi:hypothetical protein
MGSNDFDAALSAQPFDAALSGHPFDASGASLTTRAFGAALSGHPFDASGASLTTRAFGAALSGHPFGASGASLTTRAFGGCAAIQRRHRDVGTPLWRKGPGEAQPYETQRTAVKRIVILGRGGAGRSTLGQQLGESSERS